MCLLLVLRGYHPSHPILVGANRDERTDRKSAPPGLWVGARHRILGPRDRAGGGTWLAVDEHGRFAGITNWKAAPDVPEGPSRGLLPYLALEQEDFDGAVEEVAACVAERPHPGFQLVLCEPERTIVLRHDGSGVRRVDWEDEVLLITNEHGPGELSPPGFAAAVGRCPGVGPQLDQLVPLLTDRGLDGGHAACKHGEHYGTVSSSLIGVPAGDPRKLHWRFASGPPDCTPYRNYGNLGRRLLSEDTPAVDW